MGSQLSSLRILLVSPPAETPAGEAAIKQIVDQDILAPLVSDQVAEITQALHVPNALDLQA